MKRSDPLHGIMNRRDFIAGATTGVVGAVAMGATVSAQTPPAGPPAPSAASLPNGRVFYSALSGETIQIKGHNGDAIDAYVARPAGNGPFPGVVVIHHMPGWEALKDFRATRKANNQHPPVSPDPLGCATRRRTGENTSHNAEASTPIEHNTKVIRMPINVASAPPTSAPIGHRPLNNNCAQAVTRPRSSGGVIDCLKVAS